MSSITALNGAFHNGMIEIKDAGLIGMITLRGDLKSEVVAKALNFVLGVTVPDQRKITSTPKGSVAWMSPDELLIIIEYKDVSKVISSLNNILSLSLYTSDAADDLLCVDLGGRRIIKKKKTHKKTKQKAQR